MSQGPIPTDDIQNLVSWSGRKNPDYDADHRKEASWAGAPEPSAEHQDPSV